jgi:hypothetical protein
VVINIVCLDAVFRTQPNWRGAPAEHRRSSRGFADIFGVVWEPDIQGVTPYPLKERFVHGRLKPDREAHLQGTDRRMLCLLGVGTLQQVSGRACIPEVSAKERGLYCVELDYREIG